MKVLVYYSETKKEIIEAESFFDAVRKIAMQAKEPVGIITADLDLIDVDTAVNFAEAMSCNHEVTHEDLETFLEDGKEEGKDG